MRLFGSPAIISGLYCAMALLLPLATLAQSFSAESVSSNANAIVAGPCNIAQQNIAVSGQATIINEIECAPLKPEDSFLLRYLWLDATTSSFLVAGRFDPALERLLPENPVVVNNPVFQKLREIVDKFGRPNQPPYIYRYSVLAKGSSAIHPKWEIQSENSKLRIYAAEQEIVWPDVPALRTVFKTKEWPSNYSITYERTGSPGWNEPDNSVEFQNEAISCVQLYKPISIEMLRNYWSSMRELDDIVSHKEIKRDGVINNTVNYSGSVDIVKKDALKNKSIDAMLYFGEGGWPEDFLLAFGNASMGICGAGDVYNFGFYAKPRKLFTLVAVIEPRGKDLQIEHVTYLSDSREELRKLEEPKLPQHAPLGVISVKKGQMAVVPLRIELRYDISEFRAMMDSNEANKVYDRIKNLERSTLRFTGRENYERQPPPLRTVFSKSVSSFRSPKALHVTRTYVFGPAFYLNSVRVMGSDVQVRRAPAAAVAFIGTAEEGSCPFLFVSSGADEPIRVGRVLVGANKRDLARNEEINLPVGTRSFFISEQEPEVTFLETISIRDSSSDAERLLASNIVLHPGDAREFTIPTEFAGEITLTLRGYYEPLRLDKFIDSAFAPDTRAPD